MSKRYQFIMHEDGTYKEISIISESDLTLEELRSKFYDWLACMGYPVQREVTYKGENNEVIQGYGEIDE